LAQALFFYCCAAATAMASLAPACQRVAFAEPCAQPQVNLRRWRRATLLQLTGLLGGVLQAAGDSAQWHLSNAWKEHSCDDVCHLQGLKCTELCWPASVAGLRALVGPGTRLSGVCFQVAEGPAKSWHPAKDADNTLCYWNPGQLQTARCPEVSQTSAQASQQGQWTRRLCPCVNQTSVAVSDCGLGTELAAPLPGPQQVATPSPAPTPAPTPASAPVPTQAPAVNYVAVPHSCNLCVSGFGTVDEGLNGQYLQGADGTSWKRDSLVLAKGSTGHWQFRERQMGGDFVPISQGTLLTPGSRMAPSDYFATSTGGWQVEFKSCCDLSTSSDEASAKTGDDSNSPIVIVLISIVVVIVAVAVAVSCWRWRQHQQSQKSASEEDSVDSPSKGDPGRFQLPEGTTNLPVFPPPDLDPELGTIDTQKLRGTAGSWNRGAPPVPQVPAELKDCYSHGVYEGPVQPWWLEGRDGGSSPSGGSSVLRVGDKVRLCALGANSTWNGAVGVVEIYNKSAGDVHVRLRDGRLKAVRPENCEDPSAPPRPTGSWRGHAEVSPHVTAQSQKRNLMDRGSSNGFSNAGMGSTGSSQTGSRQTGDSNSMINADAGAGVTSWLASTGKSERGLSHPFVINSGGLPSPSRGGSEWPGEWEPPMPPMLPMSPISQQAKAAVPSAPRAAARRSASTGPTVEPAAPSASKQPARRTASSGPSSRFDPPTPSPARYSQISLNEMVPQVFVQGNCDMDFIKDDLMKAQKRTQAKLAALKVQVGCR